MQSICFREYRVYTVLSGYTLGRFRDELSDSTGVGHFMIEVFVRVPRRGPSRARRRGIHNFIYTHAVPRGRGAAGIAWTPVEDLVHEGGGGKGRGDEFVMHRVW